MPPHDDFELDGDEHGHEMNPIDFADSEDVEGLEMFTLRSVGIDIGSSTTHLVFSKLVLRRMGAGFSARFRVTERRQLYRSPIMLTPYLEGNLIDFEKIKQFMHDAYHEAGFTSADIDTGAVVTTGEALKKENAKPITEFFSSRSGKFICASAGPNHEALLAAHGCGAVAMSKAVHATVLNIDCGGGTAKLSVIRDGSVTQTCAVETGARLLAFDDAGVITRVEQPAIRIMRELGYPAPVVGGTITEGQKQEFADLMADVILDLVMGAPHSQLTTDLLLTAPLTDLAPDDIAFIVFSGGVSEYVYDRDRTAYGDLGPLYGAALRKKINATKKRWLREPGEGIRATVIGAGEYTIQASGMTSYISSLDSLPALGLQVVRPYLEGDAPVEAAIRQALANFDLEHYTAGQALAIAVSGDPNYKSLRRLADGIIGALNGADANDPVYIILDQDVAKSLGGILREELGLRREVIALDSIDVGDLDFVDIGRPLGKSEAIPVTVKSLLFPSDGVVQADAQLQAEGAALAN